MPDELVAESVADMDQKAVKLLMICKEHVWTSTFAGAHCPECSQKARAEEYSKQLSDHKRRSLDRRTKHFGISG